MGSGEYVSKDQRLGTTQSYKHNKGRKGKMVDRIQQPVSIEVSVLVRARLMQKKGWKISVQELDGTMMGTRVAWHKGKLIYSHVHLDPRGYIRGPAFGSESQSCHSSRYGLHGYPGVPLTAKS
jgi:hypothetical protein